MDKFRVAAAVLVSVIVLLSYASAVFFAMTRAMPAGSESILSMLLGNLATLSGMVATYWLGTSSGSQAKDKALQDLAQPK